MKRSEQQLLAKRIIKYYENNANRVQSETVRHFVAEGYVRQSVSKVIKRYRNTGTVEYKRRYSWKRSVATPDITRKVVQMLVNTRMTVRTCARRLGLSKSTVQVIKVRENIKTKKCQKVPKYRKDQDIRAKKNSRKLTRLATKKIVVMDDETYVPIDPKNSNFKKYYNFNDLNEVPDDVRFVGEEKFPKQYLVWQAIDQFGNVSKPYVKRGSMKADEYLRECLVKRLLPFLKSKHQLSDVLFWPDMASIHYEKNVINWLESKGIQFVKKAHNTPNCPQVRPIEKFWSFCKREYSSTDRISETPEDLRKTWIKVSRKVSRKHGMAIMGSTRKKLRLVGQGGVYEPFKVKN